MTSAGYSAGVALIFDELWGSYSDWFAKSLLELLSSEFGLTTGRLLDVGCGTGRFLESGRNRSWDVYGIDPSDAMLDRARERFKGSQTASQMRQGRLGEFGALPVVDVITCIYDTLNHADGEKEVEAFFEQCASCIAKEGIVVFDFNTSSGLEDWNRIKIVDKPNVLLVSRGLYLKNEGRAYKRFSGFCLIEENWIRFEENIHNIPISAEMVQKLADRFGFDVIRFSGINDISSACRDPAGEDRVVAFLRKRRDDRIQI